MRERVPQAWENSPLLYVVRPHKKVMYPYADGGYTIEIVPDEKGSGGGVIQETYAKGELLFGGMKIGFTHVTSGKPPGQYQLKHTHQKPDYFFNGVPVVLVKD